MMLGISQVTLPLWERLLLALMGINDLSIVSEGSNNKTFSKVKPSRHTLGPQVMLAGAQPTVAVPPLPSAGTATFHGYQKSDNCDKLVCPGNLPNPRKPALIRLESCLTEGADANVRG